MKLLHLADLHLGSKLEGISRLDEQKLVMDEICEIANNENVDAVIICGDVFDKSVPSAEAEDLFFESVDRLSKNGKRFVLVIAGNHDDPVRLGCGSHFTKKHNILIATDLNAKCELKQIIDGGTKVEEVYEGAVKISKGDDKCVIAYLPYPTRSRLDKNDDDKSYEEFVADMAEKGARFFDVDTFNVFASHLFVVGGKYFNGVQEKEIKLGEALSVDKAYLPKADYVALGHLHKTQQVYKNAYYSGAIICSRLTDVSPNVLIVSGDRNGLLDVKKVPLKKAFALKQIECFSCEEAVEKLEKIDNKTYVEVVIKQSMPLISSQIRKIKKEFPFVLSIKLVRNSRDSKNTNCTFKKNISSQKLFEDFYMKKNNKKPSNDMMELFMRLLEEDDDETDITYN